MPDSTAERTSRPLSPERWDTASFRTSTMTRVSSGTSRLGLGLSRSSLSWGAGEPSSSLMPDKEEVSEGVTGELEGHSTGSIMHCRHQGSHHSIPGGRRRRNKHMTITCEDACAVAYILTETLPDYDEAKPSVEEWEGKTRESLAVWKRTGSWTEGVVTSTVVQATLWEEPQATRVIFWPSRPCTRVGLRFTVVVPLPCCPWSLSPHAYTCPVSVTARQCSAPTATCTIFFPLRPSTIWGLRTCTRPYSPRPQLYSSPLDVMAELWELPQAMSRMRLVFRASISRGLSQFLEEREHVAVL
ncbi:hypothetical protein CRUP_015639 [Coryphaenoides rupestris]|nr:hypothetical protein CRUP_015639 [Coryphaenoides rupestris]